RIMLTATLASMAAGLAILALINVWGGVVNVVLGLVVFAVGFGLVVAPATSAIMVSLPVSKAGDGSSVNLLSRQVGGAVGVALIGSVATLAYRRDLSLDDLGLSAAQQDALEKSLSGVEGVTGLTPSMQAAVDATADASVAVGLQWGLGLAALFAAVAAALAFRFEAPAARPASR
ncbi:MAG: hypothetical protein AAGA42_03050, partial [Actinomycetota bacterium]